MRQETRLQAALVAIGCLQGGYMVFDGVHKIVSGSYFGGRVGPWGAVVRAVGMNVDHMGVIFVCVGTFWLIGCVTLLLSLNRGAALHTAAAIMTLLYPLFGTLLSIITLLIIWKLRHMGFIGRSSRPSNRLCDV